MEELPLWAVSNGASTWMIDLEPYEVCRVVGFVRRARIDPPHGTAEVTISDGTGEVVARWTMSSFVGEVPIVPRTWVILTGVAERDGDSLVFVDPEHRILNTADDSPAFA